MRPGDSLPLLWHWLYFTEPVPTSALGPDGHELLGRFLPPVRYPRRMWAGGDVTFEAPLVIGQAAERTTRIEDVTFKEGRSGPLCFVTLRHRITQSGKPIVNEIQNIVYRERTDLSDPPPKPSPIRSPIQPTAAEADGTMTVVGRHLLFRYSALTFNAHRIHCDEPFATETEGHAGLIVHGPLLATMLAEYCNGLAPGRRLKRFRYRAIAPVHANEAFGFKHDTGSDGIEAAIVKSDRMPAMVAAPDWSD